MMGFIAGVSVTLIVLFILFVILVVRLKEHFDTYKEEHPVDCELLFDSWYAFERWSKQINKED